MKENCIIWPTHMTIFGDIKSFALSNINIVLVHVTCSKSTLHNEVKIDMHQLLFLAFLSVVVVVFVAEGQQSCRLGNADKPLHTPKDCNWNYVQDAEKNCGDYELICAQGVDMACFLQPDRGSCNGAMYGFYYEPINDRCLPFLFSGCDSNTNRFPNENDCTQKCVSWNRERKELDPLCKSVFCPPGSVCSGGQCFQSTTTQGLNSFSVDSGQNFITQKRNGGGRQGQATTYPWNREAFICDDSKCPLGTRCVNNNCLLDPKRKPSTFHCAVTACPVGSVCVENVGCCFLGVNSFSVESGQNVVTQVRSGGIGRQGQVTTYPWNREAVICNDYNCPLGTRCVNNNCLPNPDSKPKSPTFRCSMAICPVGNVCVENVGCRFLGESPLTRRTASWNNVGSTRYPTTMLRSERTASTSAPKQLFGWISWWKS